MVTLKIRTGVTAIMSAAHRDLDGNMHGHTWEVTAWWDETHCAVAKQAELKSYLSVFDHTVLGENVSWAEALARCITIGLGCTKVEVRRPLEGLHAVAERG